MSRSHVTRPRRIGTRCAKQRSLPTVSRAVTRWIYVRIAACADPSRHYCLCRAEFWAGTWRAKFAADLMRRINREFAYDPKATEISTPLLDVFKYRRGVCQDFAHVMISGLRGLGLPAAYVSGRYLRTIPPPGKPRLQGADATHAWVSVWCGPQIGWTGFDPHQRSDDRRRSCHTAVGRDYIDVSPVDGVIVGSRKQKLSVAVDAIPVEEPA